ncbi:MAG: hypothetical protein HOQ45_20325 [Nocardioidaceae bacterium]|nr:hypothetical protein [Nocardioidaceae bacterium]
MAKNRVVVGPVVVLPQKETGLLGYYYQGATLPDGLDEDRVQSAVDDGLVREDVEVAALTIEDLSVVAAGDRFRQGGVVDSISSGAADEDADEGDEGDEGDARPAKTATKDAWVDFRVEESDGQLSREQLNELTKPQLQDDAEIAKLRTAEPSA